MWFIEGYLLPVQLAIGLVPINSQIFRDFDFEPATLTEKFMHLAQNDNENQVDQSHKDKAHSSSITYEIHLIRLLLLK